MNQGSRPEKQKGKRERKRTKKQKREEKNVKRKSGNRKRKKSVKNKTRTCTQKTKMKAVDVEEVTSTEELPQSGEDNAVCPLCGLAEEVGHAS